MIAAIALLLASAVSARADVALVALSDEQVLADGVQVVPGHPLPDRVAIVDFGPGLLRLRGATDVATSVIGPPDSVAITPDGSHAIVTDARRIDPGDPTRIVPSDEVSLLDITGTPRVIARARAGAGASGVAIDPTGRLALVANRSAGTVSLFAIEPNALRPISSVTIGEHSSPATPVFYAGGASALVTRDGDHRISVLRIGAAGMQLLPDTIVAGLRPYAMSAVDGRYAVAAGMAGGGRDVDMITLVDLSGATPRAIDSVGVGLTPEGVAMSPDGRFVAVTVNNGSNDPAAWSQYRPHGLLQVWAITDGHLVRRAEVPMGGWGQGVGWSRDGREIIAEAMVGRALQTWRFDGHRLAPDRTLALNEGPAGLAVAP